MSLDVGARLGHYAVTARLGEGGMGEVWCATDTQLNRDVALKILPHAFATDPDRLARFPREAQVLLDCTTSTLSASARGTISRSTLSRTDQALRGGAHVIQEHPSRER